MVHGSQSFIHQVRILSRKGWAQAKVIGGSQSFIHQVRILSEAILVPRLAKAWAVAILYSSSQNSLTKEVAWGVLYDDYLRPSQSFIHQVRILSKLEKYTSLACNLAGRNPLFIKSEFSQEEENMENKVTIESQSFIHQVRILSLGRVT